MIRKESDTVLGTDEYKRAYREAYDEAFATREHKRHIPGDVFSDTARGYVAGMNAGLRDARRVQHRKQKGA